jgi:small subunit ribosomal protein S6
MSVEVYETMILFDATKLTVDPDGIRAGVAATIEKTGGKIEVARPWDDRRIAYPIQKQKKGAYHILYYRMESTLQPELEREFKLNENIMRQMTSRIDPKWADAMLDVAKNETGAAFALRGMHDDPPAAESNLAGLAEGEVPPPIEGVPAIPPRRPRRGADEKPE